MGEETKMSENGAEKRHTIWRDMAEQLSDHVDLAALELRYEAQTANKRLVAAAIVLVLVLTGFIVLQVAVVGALMRTGLSLGLASFLLSLVYFGAALGIYWIFGRRDERAGPPFMATQKEVHETLRWIQKIFS
jgi:uncharacterized membrane protein YqjE